jgi:hypothetical protein
MSTETIKPGPWVEQEAGELQGLLNKPMASHSAFDLLLDKEKHDQTARAAGTFSKADCVPRHFKGKPEAVFIVLTRAYVWQVDPMMALEQTFEIGGKLGLAARLAIALANRSGLLREPIEWDVTGSGDTLSATAYAHLKSGRRIEATVDMKLARDEGWTSNKKYKTMPENMLMWRAATWLVRRYMPEVLLGMSTADELQDLDASERPRTTQPAVPERTLDYAAQGRKLWKDIKNADSIESLQACDPILRELESAEFSNAPKIRKHYADRMRELATPAKDPENMAQWKKDLSEESLSKEEKISIVENAGGVSADERKELLEFIDAQ